MNNGDRWKERVKEICATAQLNDDDKKEDMETNLVVFIYLWF